jgi:hypothetical protein
MPKMILQYLQDKEHWLPKAKEGREEREID